MQSSKKFILQNSKPGEDFLAWNESMSDKFDHSLYYENIFSITTWIEKQRLNIISNEIKKIVRKKEISNPSILEVGCGDGYVLKKISDKVPSDNIIGIDANKKWLAQAEKRLGKKAKLKYGFAEELPFENNSIDFVVCTEVLEHVIDPKLVINELKRVTKPGGTIIISIPNEELIHRIKGLLSFIRIYRFFLSHVPEENEWHLHDFDLNLLKNIIPEGIRINSIIKIPIPFIPIRYMITLQKHE